MQKSPTKVTYIYCINEAVLDLAHEYAINTKGVFVGCNFKPHHGSNSMSNHVVIGLISDLTNEIIENCCRLEKETMTAIGLVLGQSIEHLRDTIGRLTIALSENCAGERWRSLWISFDEIGGKVVDDSGDLLVIGRGASAEMVKEALATPANFMVLQTHCDGYDSPLPGGAVLCPYIGKKLAIDDVPSCQKDDFCYRLGTQRNSPKAADLLVDAESLSVDVLLFLACFVMPLAIENRDSRATLGAVLSRRVGIALICPLDAASIPSCAAMRFVEFCAETETIGCAVAKLNASFRMNRQALNVFLFGDPRYQPDKKLFASMLLARAKLTKVEDYRLDLLHRIAYYERFIEHLFCKATNRDDLLVDRSSLESQRLNSLVKLHNLAELALINANKAANLEIAVDDFSESLIHYLKIFCSLGMWLAWSQAFAQDDHAICPHCKAQSTSIVSSHNNRDYVRKLISCSKCGIASDTNSNNRDLNVELMIVGKRDVLIRILKNVDHEIRVCIRLTSNGRAPFTQMSKVTRRETEILASSFFRNNLIPSECFFDLQVICAWGAELSMYSRRLIRLTSSPS